MFNPRGFDNSRPDGVAVLEVVPDPETQADASAMFVPLRRTELTGDVAGPVGSLKVRHVFGYTSRQCDKVLEAVYRFPLPGDAAVTGVRVRFGDAEIRAELKERQRAEQDYADARSQGRQAALLTRESPDVFTLQVAGIKPDQDIAVDTEYVQLARPEGVGWSLRLPLTTSPRYVRGDELGSRHAQGQPLCLLRDPGHRFSLDVKVTGGDVQSPTHRLSTTPEGDALRVRLEAGEVLPDRDCVLTWQPRRFADRPALHVLTHDDAAGGHVYFLALVAPPGTPPKSSVPRETIVLVDHSGSMQGPKWNAADWAVKKFLATLAEHDTFNLGLFHNTTRWFAKGMQSATKTAVGQAVKFLEDNRDQGGTELGVALEQALSKPRFQGDAARHVLILTDAEVSDSGRILRLADEESKLSDRRRIDVLCIDAAPNSFLASELAARGGGVSKFLTSDPAEEDIATALDEVLADWHQPVLADLKLEVNRIDGQAAGRDVSVKDGVSQIDLGDLPAGRSVWVAGRVPRGDGELKFRVVGGKGEVAESRVAVRESSSRPALKPLFGARRVLGLEYLITSGYDGDQLRDQLARLGYDAQRDLSGGQKVYAENQRADAAEALKTLLVREALNYGLASSETAFVAVRSEAGQQVAATVAVANALPAGWSEQFVAGYGGGGMVMCAAPPVTGTWSSADAPMLREAADDFLGQLGDVARSFAPRARSSRMTKSSLGAAPPAASVRGPSPTPGSPLFDGRPAVKQGEAVLFDTTDGQRVPDDVTPTALRLEFPDGTPRPEDLDAGLMVLLFVDDLAAPRARVSVADLVRQGGERPLNVRRSAGQRVRVVIADANGTWARTAPKVRLSLRWA